MRRYREPALSVERHEPDLPLPQRILCAIVITVLVVGVVWISVWMDHKG